ncbi:hypothetical protein [Psychroserpens sp. NJDZ02]|uniref:hypothetical protein n=1 Tax=Psychroserpens sp. NJDZ02 TaxID=2570561 RepID=UPI0010A85048|nr:hypothetical protein [Psychroserpens sp. NJDZ02]QCE43380.1 hypothetical protein E9099_18790 [Psychroserpens sp. NJDZ02]
MSCKQKTSESELKTNEPKEIVSEENIIVCKEQSQNGIEFKTCLKEYDFFQLKSLDGKELYRNDNNPYEFVFTDFNEDGFLDIELHFITNVPDVNEILIFNSESNTFLEIENFSNFPSSVKIKNTNYYYSYHRSGCADSNWDSDLYFLESTKAVRIGNISGIGCEGEYETGIFISKVIGDNKELVKKVKREPEYYADKWDFIKNYWTKNYKLYE